MGKGSIWFILKSGEKKVLRDVYYISGLHSNIISLGQANEAGCEVSMKENTLTLLDREGYTMIKTTRTKNRMYKVTLQADIIQCLQAQASGGGALWHASVGHFNKDKETMRMMVNKEFVEGVPNLNRDTEACVSCLQGKQARKPFPQATHFRATNILELVHADLCGPISPSTPAHSRYVFDLIDDTHVICGIYS